MRPCRQPGCGVLIEGGGFCPKHAKKRGYDRWRGSSASRGYGYRWQKARKAYLREHPLCVMCAREGEVTAATVVDHIEPHKGDVGLFWDRSNWQSLCKRHHDQKTVLEDGGFGR